MTIKFFKKGQGHQVTQSLQEWMSVISTKGTEHTLLASVRSSPPCWGEGAVELYSSKHFLESKIFSSAK